MATWQYDVNLKIIDTPDLGSAGSKLSRIDALASRFLVKKESWSKDLSLWGEENGNRIDIFHKDSIIYSIKVRIDVSSDYKAFIYEIFRLADAIGAHLFTESGKPLDNPGELDEAIKKSDACRFVADRYDSLDSLSRKVYEDQDWRRKGDKYI